MVDAPLVDGSTHNVTYYRTVQRGCSCRQGACLQDCSNDRGIRLGAELGTYHILWFAGYRGGQWSRRGNSRKCALPQHAPESHYRTICKTSEKVCTCPMRTTGAGTTGVLLPSGWETCCISFSFPAVVPVARQLGPDACWNALPMHRVLAAKHDLLCLKQCAQLTEGPLQASPLLLLRPLRPQHSASSRAAAPANPAVGAGRCRQHLLAAAAAFAAPAAAASSWRWQLPLAAAAEGGCSSRAAASSCRRSGGLHLVQAVVVGRHPGVVHAAEPHHHWVQDAALQMSTHHRDTTAAQQHADAVDAQPPQAAAQAACRGPCLADDM